MIEANSLRSSSASKSVATAFGVWLFLAMAMSLTIAAIIAAPVAQHYGHPVFAGSIYQTFSYLCHQIPERSFHLGTHQFAVCSRCTGLYAGFSFVTLGYPLFRSLKRTDSPRIIWLLLAVVPLTIDFALGYFSIWENNHLTRVVTGGLLGAVAAFYVVPGLIDLSFKFTQVRIKIH